MSVNLGDDRFSLYAHSNAGKFADHGEVVVTIAVVTHGASERKLSLKQGNTLARKPTGKVAPQLEGGEGLIPANRFLCVTISNTRCGALIPKPEDCFVPFKQETTSELSLCRLLCRCTVCVSGDVRVCAIVCAC